MSDLIFTSPPDEITPESASEPDPEPIGSGIACVVCGKDITALYGGRGAKPKYCEDHKTNRPKAAASSGRMTKDARLRQDLATMMGTLGFALMMVEAYDGLVVIDRTEATVDALMDVAEHEPKVKKILEQMVTVSVWGQVSMAVAGLALPIAAHHGVLPIPTEFVEAQFLSEATQKKLAELPPKRRKNAAPMGPRIVPDPPSDDVKLDAFGRPL